MHLVQQEKHMSSIALSPARPVLADRLGSRSLAMNTALVVGGAALTAGAAQISIPMWPVPITGQTFAVLLVGTTLGMWRGALSMVFYIALGALGLPVFTGAQGGLDSLIGGPTVGYLLGFVLAGALTGWLAERGIDRSVWGAAAIFVAGEAVIYAVGLPMLSNFLSGIGAPHDISATLAAGFTPFIIGDVLKAVLAGALLPLTWKLVNRKP